MQFFLSKVLRFLLIPFNWILLLLLAYFFTKNLVWKKRLLTTIIICFFVFSNSFLLNETMLAWQFNKSTIEKGRQYEAGIVLGGLSMFDQNNQGYFTDQEDRFLQTLELYNQGIIKKIIISGGSGQLLKKEPPEADFLKEKFLLHKVKLTDIIIENKSRNTFENAVFTKKIIDSLQLNGPFILISSAWHLRRATKVFTKAGLIVKPYPCAFEAISKKYNIEDYVWPNLKALITWGSLLKEIVGLAIYSTIGKA